MEYLKWVGNVLYQTFLKLSSKTGYNQTAKESGSESGLTDHFTFPQTDFFFFLIYLIVFSSSSNLSTEHF